MNINPTTQFFLDSCDPNETKQALLDLSHLEGQTTNPTLLVKNPLVQARLDGGKMEEIELLALYKKAIQEISNLIPNGSVSIEVYADWNSTKEDLLKQAYEFNQWIPNAHIKFPTIKAGLEAAEEFVNGGGRVNMTLVFSQEQALAVHLATKKMKNKGDVLLSPFLGRLDDIGQNGMDLINNVRKMYVELNSDVSLLAASTRTLDHVLGCLKPYEGINCDIITAPLSLWQTFSQNSTSLDQFEYLAGNLKAIDYIKMDYNQDWKNVDINHELTTKGLDRFVADWNSVINR
jgi:transaldolase